jgi:hypothetical protein
MRLTIRVDPTARLAVVRVAGTVRGPDLLALVGAPLADPAWEPGFSIAWDVRGLGVVDLVPADLAPFGEGAVAVRPRMGPGRSAVLARDDRDEVTVRLLDLQRGGHRERELRAFTRVHEAAAWLGVPEDVLEGR